jgi:hypothetical protein
MILQFQRRAGVISGPPFVLSPLKHSPEAPLLLTSAFPFDIFPMLLHGSAYPEWLRGQAR